MKTARHKICLPKQTLFLARDLDLPFSGIRPTNGCLDWKAYDTLEAAAASANIFLLIRAMEPMLHHLSFASEASSISVKLDA